MPAASKAWPVTLYVCTPEPCVHQSHCAPSTCGYTASCWHVHMTCMCFQFVVHVQLASDRDSDCCRSAERQRLEHICSPRASEWAHTLRDLSSELRPSFQVCLLLLLPRPAHNMLLHKQYLVRADLLNANLGQYHWCTCSLFHNYLSASCVVHPGPADKHCRAGGG